MDRQQLRVANIEDYAELQIAPVVPAVVNVIWETVEDDLKACIEHDFHDVRIEDVYTALRVGAARLHMGYVRKQYVGCLVTQEIVDPYSGVPMLHLWLVHGQLRGEQGLPYVEELAREIGAKRITFSAPRESYARWARPHGFKLVRVECMKEI